MPIFGSPAYSDGTIYIVSNDYHLYALDASDLSFKWSSIPINMDIVVPTWPKLSAIGTPNVAEGVVYVGAGVFCGEADPAVDYMATGHSTPAGHFGGAMRFMAFDAETGESIWNQTRAGNTLLHVPAYWEGQIYGPEFFYITSMDADNPNSGPDELGDFGGFLGRQPGNRTWAAWVGYQSTSSVAYADDLTGPKVYAGSDIGSIYCFDARTGETLSVFGADGNVPSSPAIWEGKLYTGGCDGKVRCFDSAPVVEMSISAASNKGAEMWNTETLEICGELTANPIVYVWDADEEDPSTGVWIAQASEFHPGIPDAEVQLYLTKPDGSDVSLTTTTGEDGYFEFSYSPTEVGEWGWVINFDGGVHPEVIYAAAYGEWNPFTVNSPTAGPSNGNGNGDGNGNGTEPPPESLPMEYVYAAIAVIIIVVVAFLAYFFLKKR
jgi:outer membrane protein assembly factor BamB